MKGCEALPAERCGTCRYFRKHYIRMGEDCYSPLTYGHCVYPALKKRRGEERCPHWCALQGEEGEEGENGL